MRFLFGGLATVAGLVLLFVASFGDPGLVLQQFKAVFSPTAPSHAPAVTQAPAVTADNAPAGKPQEHAMAVLPPSQSPSPPPQPQANQGPSPTQPSSAQSPPPASPPTDQTAAMSAQREALQQQLQHLQAQMAQASQNVSSLHDQADEERHDLDALQRQRAAEEAQASQRDADRDRGAAAAAQTPESSTPAANPTPDQSGPAAAPAPTVQAAAQPEPLPLPPPLPPNPPQQSPSIAAAPTVPAPPVAARTDATTAGRFAAATPERERSQRLAQSDPAATQAVLDRLRHASPDVAPQAASPGPDITPPGAPPGQGSPAPRGQAAAYGQPPRQIGPNARLGMARAALVAGRIPDAQQYLEEAQLQLVFRPVTPDADDAPGASHVAGDVAAALSMLGAGNISGALQYVDRAMQQPQSGGYPPPRSYGYGGPYGGTGAPVAEAGH